jgi:hypothetical protein
VAIFLNNDDQEKSITPESAMDALTHGIRVAMHCGVHASDRPRSEVERAFREKPAWPSVDRTRGTPPTSGAQDAADAVTSTTK